MKVRPYYERFIVAELSAQSELCVFIELSPLKSECILFDKDGDEIRTFSLSKIDRLIKRGVIQVYKTINTSNPETVTNYYKLCK